jgi:hypothetical protein
MDMIGLNPSNWEISLNFALQLFQPFAMRHFLYLSLLFIIACQAAVPKAAEQKAPAPGTPMGPAEVSFTDLNCWVEQDKFFVIGICNNESARWQQISLKMDPVTASGQPVAFNGSIVNIFPVYANAVPPKGRSSFFAFWPLSAFKSKPDTCRISGAGAQVVAPGPILLTENQSAVKMKTGGEDFTWLASTTVNNPLDLPAGHPRLELLLYGTDNRLWMSTVLNPEDPAQKKTLQMEREGVLEPGEKRTIGCSIVYDNLPARLRTVKIGKVAFQAFDARQ